MENEHFRGNYLLRVTTEKRDGRTYERVYLRSGVAVIPITEEGNIRFVREHHWGYNEMRTKLVTGYIEDGESPQEAARRELQEELGLTAEHWTLFVRSEKNDAVHKVQQYFIARGLREGPTSPQGGERIEGSIDLDFEEVFERTLRGEFGTTGTAFALLKLVVSRMMRK